jgi:hypothetical protein
LKQLKYKTVKYLHMRKGITVYAKWKAAEGAPTDIWQQ